MINRELYSKIKNIVKRGIIQQLDDSGPVAKITARVFGRNQKSGQVQPYGLVGVPPAGTPIVIFNLLSQESNQLSIAYDSKNRIKGFQPGTTGIENYLSGDHIIFIPPAPEEDHGTIQINSATGAQIEITSGGGINIISQNGVEIEAPGGVEISGDVEIDGNLDVTGTITGAPEVDLVTHTHIDSIGGTTGQPQS